MSSSLNEGSCLCGAVHFRVTHNDALSDSLVAHCHCTMCQKFHGAAFSTFIEISNKDFEIKQGQDCISTYTAENASVRHFCQQCGSSLFFESVYNKQNNTIEVSLATFDCLDKSEQIEPDAHIFIESKVPWLAITDTLTQHETYRK